MSIVMDLRSFCIVNDEGTSDSVNTLLFNLGKYLQWEVSENTRRSVA